MILGTQELDLPLELVDCGRAELVLDGFRVEACHVPVDARHREELEGVVSCLRTTERAVLDPLSVGLMPRWRSCTRRPFLASLATMLDTVGDLILRRSEMSAALMNPFSSLML